MGSISSKVARGATRKYPTRAPGSAITSTPAARARAPPTARKPEPRPLGDGSKDEAIRADAMDPDFPTGDFSRRLQQMGVVQPNPTFSPSSTASPELGPSAPMGPMFPAARSNQTLTALEARQRLQQAAEQDFEAMGRSERRRFLDMRTVVDAIKMRDHGVPQQEIEHRLRIQPGLLQKFGRPGLLSHVSAN